MGCVCWRQHVRLHVVMSNNSQLMMEGDVLWFCLYVSVLVQLTAGSCVVVMSRRRQWLSGIMYRCAEAGEEPLWLSHSQVLVSTHSY